MSEQPPLFTHSFLMSCWAEEYKGYCSSDEDTALLLKLKHWSEKDFQKETQSEANFLQTFFFELWGYVASGSAEKSAGYTLFPQFPVENAGQNGGVGKADAAMGWFGETELPNTPQILCEFKDIRSGLDTRQNRKGNDRTPVMQCADYLSFSRHQFTPYGNEKIQPSWGIVTDMNEFRLYYKARMPQQYERFVIKRSRSRNREAYLLGTTEEARQKRFIFSRLFHADWLLNRSGEPPLLGLFSAQGEQEKSLEKAFYFEYRDYRDELFKTLLAVNPLYKEQPRKLVRLTQKLLDRFLFVLFCEDMGAHLQYPVNLLRDLMSEYSQDDRYSADEADLWEEKVLRLFKSMREGTPFLKHPINRFNGGLFAVDIDLDGLHVPNKLFFRDFQGATPESLFKHKKTLLYFAASYNFGIEDGGDRAIGLYTLGRIFEQSITDLEIMEAEAAKEQSLMKLSKRKTNGVFYTPEWATAYIVEQTLGLRIDELKAKLDLQNFAVLSDESIASDHTKTKSQKEIGRLKKNTRSLQYFDLLDAYSEELGKLKILDPACGSGAFLIQALKRLLQEHEWVSAEKSRVNYQFSQGTVFDKAKAYREILAKNLYGVDVNAESVEITKLALWLHTVMPGKPLSSLDDNILCGNSLVDTSIEDVVGKLSVEQYERINPFNYHEAFSEVFENGGFDVIIGNPPYIKLQNMRRVQKEATDYWLNAEQADGSPRFRSTQTGSYDIYLPFTEKCIELLNPTGRMGFIQPNVWAVNEYGRGLREMLHETRRMDRWIDFKSYQIFDEAITYTALQFFSGQAVDGIKLHFAPNGGDDLVSLDWENVEALPYEKLPASDTWQFMPESERLLVKKLVDENPSLDEFPEIIVGFRGVETGADYMFHFHKVADGQYSYSKANQPSDVIELEDDIMKLLASGGDAARYTYPQPDVYVLFPFVIKDSRPHLLTEEEIRNLHPKAWEYFKSREAELRARESRKMDRDDRWWGYNYPKNLEKMSWPKLGIAQTVQNMEVFFDHRGECYFNNVRVGGISVPKIEDMWFLLGILNAQVANYAFKRMARAKDNDYFEANKQFIAPLPIPVVDDEQKQQVAEKAEKLQELHTRYRNELEKLTKRMNSAQFTEDTKPLRWIWAELPEDCKSLKQNDKAKATGLKGAALTKWTKEHYGRLLSEKLKNLAVRMNPKLILTVVNDDGELRLLADGVPAFDSVFVDEEEAPFIAAQWKYVIRTTNITPGLTAEKLLPLFLQIKRTENDNLKKQVMLLDAKLDQLSFEIEKQESEMNMLIYRLYNLSKDDIRQIALG